MENERLRAAMIKANATVDDVAEEVDVDPKTVHRWLAGRVPHKRHRFATAMHLRADPSYLWPDGNVRRRKAKEELIDLYPNRASVPRETWLRMLSESREAIDVLVFSGTFYAQTQPAIARMLAERASKGVRVRLCFGDPNGEAVAVRDREEGIANTLGHKIRSALTYYRSLLTGEGCEVRLHDTTLYASLFRYDNEMIVNPHAYGEPATANPCLHVCRLEGGSLFDHYLGSFERVWASARLWNGELG